MEQLLEEISSRELTEWMVYFGIEGPTGDQRADWRAGMIASTVANVNRDPKKQREPWRPEQFMPQFDQAEEKREQSVEAQAAMARALQKALGGEIKTSAEG